MNFQTVGKSIRAERLLMAATVLGEVLRTYPWLVFLSGLSIHSWAGPPLNFISAVAVISVSTLLAGPGVARRLRRPWARGALLFGAALSLLLLTRLENGGGYALWDSRLLAHASEILVQLIVGFVFCLFLVRRGITLGRKDMDLKFLRRNLATGLGSFILLIFVWAVRGGQAGQSLFALVAPYAISYLVAAGTALGMGNYLTLRRSLASQSGAEDLFSRRWLVILLGVVAGIAVTTLLVAAALSANLALVVRPLDALASRLIAGLVFVFLHSFGYILVAIEWLAMPVVNWLARLSGSNQTMTLEGFRSFANDANISAGQMPADYSATIKWAVIAIAVAVVAYFLWRVLRSVRRGETGRGYRIDYESLWSWGTFGEDLESFLKSASRRSWRRRALRRPPLACTITGPQALSIREVYLGLLWEGAASGHPKNDSQTAYEYRASLNNWVGGQQGSIEAITDAYVRDRYGHTPVARDEGTAIVGKWLDLRSAMRAKRSPV